MLKKLRLERFKNFKQAELALGPLTILVGANASGKSNLRDAFRFLHGIGRGYSLPEIFGEKWTGGEKQWEGIRGGIREVTYQQSSTFVLKVDYDVENSQNSSGPPEATYCIEVEVGAQVSAPRVLRESLYYDKEMIFDSHPKNPPQQADSQHIVVKIQPGGKYRKGNMETFISNQPVLSQLPERIAERTDGKARQVKHLVKEAIAALNSVRFLDLSPEAMRMPSFPGRPLDDRGENLSSVLHTICEDVKRKEALIEWIQELTPMDCVDFEFSIDQIGRVLVTLVEQNGQKISVYSASDGTLRFLGLLAAMLAPEPARLYFFEELENGIHPTRLHLLLQLIEQTVSEGNIQVIASTHSPQLLGLLNQNSLDDASLIYRLPDSPDGRIKRILDIPDAKRIIEERQDPAHLHASGWLENAMYFLDDSEVTT
ncbi:AAA family ATPase [Candidatus Poribacteria bacterium]|nr:AAA family ATPase [Candidatus Poribacteria bacterium]